MRKSSKYNDPLISGGRQVIILFILIMNRITDRILPRGTPIFFCCCCFGSESVLFIRVWNVLSSKKWFIKIGSLLCRQRSLSIPYVQVVS